MTDLVAFITARLDEDEGAAHAAAAGGRWHYEDGDSVGAWTLYDEHWNIATLTTYEHSTYDYATRMPAARNPRYVAADANGRHIARHDPARVLREVEAKRRTLARHQPQDQTNGWSHLPPDQNVHLRVPVHPYCSSCRGGDCHEDYDASCGTIDWPCPEVRDLTAAWSDHPDYRSEWRPS